MNELTVSTDPLGLATTYGYGPAGNQVTVEDPMDRFTTTVFDALNRPAVVIDPMTNRTTTTYNADGEVVQVVDPMGRTTTTSYSVRGWVPTVTDPLANVTSTYSYKSTTGQTLSTTQQRDRAPAAVHQEYRIVYAYNADDERLIERDRPACRT